MDLDRLEALFDGQKDFFFEEVALGHLQLEDEMRYSYNIYTKGGSRLCFLINPVNIADITTKRFFKYELCTKEQIVAHLNGDQYGGISDVCCCCCVCKGQRGIHVIYNNMDIGSFFPINNSIMSCLFSWLRGCYCYIDKYAVQFKSSPEPEDSFNRIFTRKLDKIGDKQDAGLEIYDESNGDLIGIISNSIGPINNQKECQISPFILDSFKTTETKVQFALSLSRKFVDINPFCKIVLIALAVFHESEVMHRDRAVRKKKNVGFFDT